MKKSIGLVMVMVLMFGIGNLAQATVINFDLLAEHTAVTNQFPEATFSSTPGKYIKVTDHRNFGNSQPFFICTAPNGSISQDCIGDVFVSFTNPVNNLTFLSLGDNNNGAVGFVDVFVNGLLNGTVSILGNGDPNDPFLVDMHAYSNITSIHIRNITDLAGLGYDDFTFTASVPEPGALILLGSGLLGLVGFRRKFTK